MSVLRWGTHCAADQKLLTSALLVNGSRLTKNLRLELSRGKGTWVADLANSAEMLAARLPTLGSAEAECPSQEIVLG
jgi:hypothetical protein